MELGWFKWFGQAIVHARSEAAFARTDRCIAGQRHDRDFALRAGQLGSCPGAWCSWRRGTAFTGKGRAGQLAIAGRLTVGSSLKGAMVSSVM